ncbi:hypothetical protein J2S78_000931 [Salibacterium salarium]|uniref:hypothetical protein n=1 Tax=Salibacterium salarium TaxID=284579 RepID=UPI0027881237|nr:hypothetical protein [Salibacterium salarium]MDQ0298523.1 hypothetical protein [Salibacterium salarium]
MSDEQEKQILHELNAKLDEMSNKNQGLSTPVKIIALFIGFTVLGPLCAYLFEAASELF